MIRSFITCNLLMIIQICIKIFSIYNLFLNAKLAQIHKSNNVILESFRVLKKGLLYIITLFFLCYFINFWLFFGILWGFYVAVKVVECYNKIYIQLYYIQIGGFCYVINELIYRIVLNSYENLILYGEFIAQNCMIFQKMKYIIRVQIFESFFIIYEPLKMFIVNIL